MRSLAWLAILVLGISSLAEAQPRRGGDPAGAVERRREAIKRKIRAMRAYALTEELALDEPTAGRLFPVLARYDDQIDRLLEKRRDIQSRLREADTVRDPRALDRLLDEAVANQRRFWDLEEKRLGDLRKILTPVQTAKLLVVLPAFDRRIQNQLSRAIVRRSAGEVRPEDDDDEEADDALPPPRPLRRREAPLAPRGSMSNAPGNTPPCDPNEGPCR
jgi:hypothetical protein